MQSKRTSVFPATSLPLAAPLTALAAACLLAACGGGDAPATVTATPAAAVASSTTVLDLQTAPPDDVAATVAVPTFHLAPVLLDDPGDADAAANAASASSAPRATAVPAAAVAAGALRATARAMAGLQHGTTVSPMGGVTPAASSSTVITYTPAQIRAAYSLPVLPAAGASLTAALAAQLGAGQTIYIVDAMHDPNAAAELATFDQRFGLPACTTRAIAPTTKLPLAAPTANACDLSVVYGTASGTMTATAPAYDAGWATEIALDVQWAHATAPLARIVLIEAPDASLSSLLGAVNLANAMGSGVVSMSFGAGEGSYTASVDSAFTGTNMTYLASSGDSGAGVSWPAVSPHVLAVGGTSLAAAGNGTRSESAWSGSGGGISQYTPRPSYQSSAVPGMVGTTYRDVADVAFNADPYTGQYLAVISSSGALSWLSAGGTSLAAPQWAGLVAVANAMRAQNGKAPLGAPHALFYGQIAPVPGTYASDFGDIKSGADGSCATCAAKLGYDTPTGLGTPNAGNLLATLAGPSAPTPPVVTPAIINGQVGTALSFTVNVSAPDPVSYALASAPSGMAVSAAGVVTWATPIAGTYGVAVTATDTKTQLKGSGTYTVVIAPPQPPVVAAETVAGQVGTALSFTVPVTAPNPVTLSLAGAPSGMSLSSAGSVAWAVPVAGTYRVTVTARDTRTGLTGQGIQTVTVSALPPPLVAAKTVTGTVGTSLSFQVAVTAPDAVTYSLSGAPAGMTIGTTGIVGWAAPVAGSYGVVVTARDTKSGLAGSGTMTVQIAPSGLTITAPPMSGVAGKALTGTITIADPGAAWIQLSLGGVPLGMTFSVSGMTLTASWANPVAGQYTIQAAANDSAGRSVKVAIPVTVTAH